MIDPIDRQAALDVIDAIFPVDPMKSEYAQGIACGAALAKTYVEALPSAQPEKRTNERTETHACDLISRQSVLKAIDEYERLSAVSQTVRNMMSLQEIVQWLPSAQPEIIRCKDCKWSQTINFFGTKATSCKWWEKLTDVDAFCSNGVRRNEDE